MKHPKDNAGYRIARRTGPGRSWVTVYDAVASAIEDDPEMPWAVVCEAHSTLVCAESRTSAEAIMRGGSVVFCDECREVVTKEDLDLVLDAAKNGDEAGVHEVAARWRKIALLIAALYKHGVPVDRAVRLGKRQLRMAASVAGVNDPSDETIKLLRKTIRKIPQPINP